MDSILQNEAVVRVLERMRALCSVREYCTSDIEDKIRRAGLPEDLPWPVQEVVGAIIDSLKTEEFLSDERYSAAFARDKAHLLGWGPQKIRYALLAKHIDADIIDGALAKVNESAAANRLESLLKKKYASLVSSRRGQDMDQAELRARLVRFALGRGYTFDAINPAIDRVLKV